MAANDTTVGIVGVGRMGANIARHLNDEGYAVTAVYDVNSAPAQELAAEIGAQACNTLAQVTGLADTIITVVTDDQGYVRDFRGRGRQPAAKRSRKILRQLRHHHAAGPRGRGTACGGGGSAEP